MHLGDRVYHSGALRGSWRGSQSEERNEAHGGGRRDDKSHGADRKAVLDLERGSSYRLNFLS